MPSSSNMESFLVYLFNFYYAISELEQNKQNNTIIFFLLFIFLTKKWTSAVCGGVRAHPSHPPSLRACIVNYTTKSSQWFSTTVSCDFSMLYPSQLLQSQLVIPLSSDSVSVVSYYSRWTVVRFALPPCTGGFGVTAFAWQNLSVYLLLFSYFLYCV